MSTPHSSRHRPSVRLFVAPLMIGLWCIGMLHASAAQPEQVNSGDLGVTAGLVEADTVVHTPAGTFTGPAGVEAYLATLRSDYPDVDFSITSAHVHGDLVIVEWRGTIDGLVAVPGRTLVAIDDEEIVEVSFLALNDIAPAPTA